MPNPEIDQTFDLAFEHHQAGRLKEAEAAYHGVLAQDAHHAEALHFLGVIAFQKGLLDSAMDLIRQAITVEPDFPEAHHNLGNVLNAKGQLDDAIAAYRQAVALDPQFAEAHVNLGRALARNGLLDEAIGAYRQAIAVAPDLYEAYHHLGLALTSSGKMSEAIAAFRQAVLANPEFAEAHFYLGNALQSSGDDDQAIAAFRRAIALEPKYPQALSNLCLSLRNVARFDEAIDAIRQAIAIQPDWAALHRALAGTLLLLGNLEAGWPEYEWRWRVPGFPSRQRGFTQRQWDGSDLAGRTILLHAEQGFGDTLQFMRYAPMVVARQGRVYVEVHRDLIRLLRQWPIDVQWIAGGEALPAFDVHCPLLSLPLAFSTTLQTIPAQEPILPPPELIRQWRRRLHPLAPGRKVALAWAGNPGFVNDRSRSLSLDCLSRLFEAPGVTFYSVQKGAAAEQALGPPAGARFVNLGPGLEDFADTAAVFSLMDLVITTDTSVAHLAGVLGLPVWVMLQYVPDWRWLLDRADSPWYPTMRLFRQPALGDWDSVLAAVADALRQSR